MDSLNGQHILVIEDNYFIATSIVDELISAGATVVPVATQAAAFNELTTWHFTAAVVDINLGYGPDTSAAKLLRERIPFVFLSGYDSDPVGREFSHVPFLSKPHRGQALVDGLLKAITVATVLPVR